jgi:hypothetical protein
MQVSWSFLTLMKRTQYWWTLPSTSANVRTPVISDPSVTYSSPPLVRSIPVAEPPVSNGSLDNISRAKSVTTTSAGTIHSCFWADCSNGSPASGIRAAGRERDKHLTIIGSTSLSWNLNVWDSMIPMIWLS